MGQYYTLACPETGTYADARTLGAFVKAYEQVWSEGMPSILAFLCSAGRGSHPRDLPWAPQGIWAGRMPLMVGDYAEAGDLRGRDAVMGMPEEDLYGACTGKETGSPPRPAGARSCRTSRRPSFRSSSGSTGFARTTATSTAARFPETACCATSSPPSSRTANGCWTWTASSPNTGRR